jgi:hypothetical protein
MAIILILSQKQIKGSSSSLKSNYRKRTDSNSVLDEARNRLEEHKRERDHLGKKISWVYNHFYFYLFIYF